jgi:hypothetical protein
VRASIHELSIAKPKPNKASRPQFTQGRRRLLARFSHRASQALKRRAPTGLIAVEGTLEGILQQNSQGTGRFSGESIHHLSSDHWTASKHFVS